MIDKSKSYKMRRDANGTEKSHAGGSGYCRVHPHLSGDGHGDRPWQPGRLCCKDMAASVGLCMAVPAGLIIALATLSW